VTAGGVTCQSANATAVTANVQALPANPTVTAASRCGAGTVTLRATSSGAVIDWYAASSGGTALLSGNNTYTTTNISTSTTYYAQARNSTTNCISVSRTAVLATVNTVPNAPTMGGAGTHCTGAATITATFGSGGNGIKWDDNTTAASRRVTATGTYRAITTSAAGCTSSTATVSVTIGTQSASGNAPNTACGCASGLTDCAGTCTASCGMLAWTGNECKLNYVSSVASDAYVTWSAANTLCKNKSMRLPTSSELACMCTYKSSLPGGYNASNGYWSGSDAGWTYYVVGFAGCVTSSEYESNYEFYVKCVK
jgi:hypothetical protein